MSAAADQVSYTIVPANEAPWADLQQVVGSCASAGRCQCQRYKLARGESFARLGPEELSHRLRAETDPGRPDAPSTTGLLAYAGTEPVGWCALEPRTAYPGLLRVAKVPWAGRTENKADDGVWAVTCFVTRAGFRRRGVAGALARAAVEHARRRGAHALEGYPIVTTAVISEELHVGLVGMFEAAGFRQVSTPTLRRAVMRIDF
ncbi:GNAT family N-acetyltransferase [Ruania zhangjianzhongii]|uniref:GNAT family N-acetyltransferase n=1 Tax=Ruania zhangjianzhongii TaxID=2603206 RepID=UPI001F171FA0|nr:GNAT family N-acetyltransferase [Ruania zhangjianzhongii]